VYNNNLSLSYQFAGGKPPTDEECVFVLHAADVNHVDNAIDIDEVLYAFVRQFAVHSHRPQGILLQP
jgi:hypothetical protein